jgi:hypothetical protein
MTTVKFTFLLAAVAQLVAALAQFVAAIRLPP